jgi:hypothetical protein
MEAHDLGVKDCPAYRRVQNANKCFNRKSVSDYFTALVFRDSDNPITLTFRVLVLAQMQNYLVVECLVVPTTVAKVWV